MKKVIIGIIAGLAGLVCIECHQVRTIKKKWEVAEANVKAYDRELNVTGKKNAALQLTVNQLEYFNDSVLKALDATRKELNIKDKNLRALQAISSGFTKKDTITITQVDTLFKEPSLAVDTLIGDVWYNVKVSLRYPSTIALQPYFKSVKHVIVSTKKETIGPPKKFFLLRWFQKKHLILDVNVVERNPYVENEESKYVEIIK